MPATLITGLLKGSDSVGPLVGGETEQHRREREETHVALVDRAGLDPYCGIAQTLYREGVEADLADLRGAPFDRAAHQRWAEATRAELRSVYPQAEVDDLLARTGRFVDQHPELKALLARRGIGEKPSVVVPLVEHVRRRGFK